MAFQKNPQVLSAFYTLVRRFCPQI